MALLFRYADLSPPLGVGGGPCRVVDRILREKLPPGEEEDLVGLVDADRDLSNAQAHEIYEPIVERGPQPFSQFVLTPHSQYRMDLRSVTVRDLRESLSRFVAEIETWKRKRDPRYEQLAGKQKIEWLDPKNGLFFVFGLGSHRGTPSLITTYWKNKPNPEAPAGGCEVRLAGHSAPAGELFGVRTVVEEKPAKGIQDALGDTIEHPSGESPKSDRERARPQRTDNPDDLTKHPPDPPVYNTPGPSTPGWRNPGPVPQNEKIKVRTPGVPGEEYGHPYKENIYPRRTAGEMEVEAAGAGTFPTYSQRQHKQRGDAKRYYRKYYRRRKNVILTRAKRRYRKIRNSPAFKRRRSLRNNPKYRNRFRRLPARGFRSNAERSKAWRKKHAQPDRFPLSFFHMILGWGDVLGFEDGGVCVHLDGENEETLVVPLRVFTSGMILEDEDLDAFFEEMEEAYGTPDPRYVAATFYREVFRPGYNLDPGEGAQDLGEPSPVNPELEYPDWEHDERAPGHKLDIRQMDQAPGSAKVIPSGHDFANKEASPIRVASLFREAKKLSELLGETSTDVLIRARGLKPRGKRFDQKNSMYTFSVPGATSNETYVVRMKVTRSGGKKKLGLMDLLVSCSCPFWRWQGPEHWAKVGNYLYGTPRGTASKPVIKDPFSIHKVCKHVAACLDMTKNWELPAPRR